MPPEHGARSRVAYVKYGGLAAGSSERRLQWMATVLPSDRFEVDYFWCDDAPYLDLTEAQASGLPRVPVDPDRRAFMERSRVRLVEFHVGGVVTAPVFGWIDTDFWEHFDEARYDFVQTVKAGPREHPFDQMSRPVVEVVAYNAGADPSPNLAFSIHPSEWQRRQWCRRGGRAAASVAIPNAVVLPAAQADLRAELGIPAGAIVAGFHQRDDDAIHSPIPLAAFAEVVAADRHFVVMGGGDRYRTQAAVAAIPNVHFVPHSGDNERIATFLGTLDVFAHGRSDGETFGTVLVEAMAAGLPCLSHASSTGNNAQLESMGPGGLFAGEDAHDYARLLERLFAEPALRADLARRGLAHATKYYGPERCAIDLIRLYEHLASGDAGPFRTSVTPYGHLEGLDVLWAGTMDGSVLAAHVVLGGLPCPAAFDLVQRLAMRADAAVVVGDAVGLWAAAAAAGIPLTVVGSGAPGWAAETVDLNRWETRVELVDEVPATAPQLVVVDAGSVRPTLPESLERCTVLIRSSPEVAVDLLRAPALEHHGTAQFSSGGRRWRAGRREAVVLTVAWPPGEALDELLRRWRRDAAAERRRARLDLGVRRARRALRPVRRGVRAVIARTRRS